MPSWGATLADFTAGGLAQGWAILPMLLPPIGFGYVRGATSPGRRRAAWAGAAAAGIVLEVLMVAHASTPVTGTPDWGSLAESPGFAAAGTAMILVLIATVRSPAGQLQGR